MTMKLLDEIGSDKVSVRSVQKTNNNRPMKKYERRSSYFDGGS